MHACDFHIVDEIVTLFNLFETGAQGDLAHGQSTLRTLSDYLNYLLLTGVPIPN